VYNQLLFYNCLGQLFYWAKICSKDVTSYTFVNVNLVFYFYGAHKSMSALFKNQNITENIFLRIYNCKESM